MCLLGNACLQCRVACGRTSAQVIVGTVTGSNVVANTDFNARGEYMGGPDGCALDFETSATAFTVQNCTFSHSYGSGIMVFGHATTSHDIVIDGNTFLYDGCIQPRSDHGGIAFMCPNNNKPSGTVSNNYFLTCPNVPAFFNRIPDCDSDMTFKGNTMGDFTAVAQPIIDFSPPPPTSNATSGVLPTTGVTTTAGAVVRYTLDGSRPTESSPVVPAAGIPVPWPGPVVAINMRAFHPDMLPSVTNGVVLEDDYGMGRAVHTTVRGLGGSFDTVSVTPSSSSQAATAVVTGWAVDGALPGGGVPPVTVRITVNRTRAAVVSATVPRPDVVKAGDAPNPDHGFSLQLPSGVAAALAGPGMHYVEAWAFGTPGSLTPWLLPNSPHCVCAGQPCTCT